MQTQEESAGGLGSEPSLGRAGWEAVVWQGGGARCRAQVGNGEDRPRGHRFEPKWSWLEGPGPSREGADLRARFGAEEGWDGGPGRSPGGIGCVVGTPP